MLRLEPFCAREKSLIAKLLPSSAAASPSLDTCTADISTSPADCASEPEEAAAGFALTAGVSTSPSASSASATAGAHSASATVTARLAISLFARFPCFVIYPVLGRGKGMRPNRPHPLASFAYVLCGFKRGPYASSKPHFCQISWALSLLRHQSRNSWVAAAFLLSEVTAPGYTMFLCVLAGTVPTICTPPKR